MPDTVGSLPSASAAASGGRYIFIACPWTPVGGGMYKVADYLIQSQALDTPLDAAKLRPLDTRGGGSGPVHLLPQLERHPAGLGVAERDADVHLQVDAGRCAAAGERRHRHPRALRHADLRVGQRLVHEQRRSGGARIRGA